MTEFKRTVAEVEAIAEELQMEWDVEKELGLKKECAKPLPCSLLVLLSHE